MVSLTREQVEEVLRVEKKRETPNSWVIRFGEILLEQWDQSYLLREAESEIARHHRDFNEAGRQLNLLEEELEYNGWSSYAHALLGSLRNLLQVRV